MEYSKIHEIEVINFMSFKHAKVVFDESNIIVLKGYNDFGKSAFLRAVMVCLADINKKSQAKYIRHGETYFRVVVTFDDGVSILRDKYKNGQSLYEMYKGQELIYTSKQGNQLTRIDGVPKPIRDYVGLCMTESGCFNYQERKDTLLLVETTGSETYRELNEVLKFEEISRAVSMINTDKNEMNTRMIELERQYTDKRAVLLSRQGVDEGFINLVDELDKESEVLESEADLLKEISENYQSYIDTPQIPVMHQIDVSELGMLEELSGIFDRMKATQDIPEMQKINSVEYIALSEIGKLLEELERYQEIPVVGKVDTSELESLDTIIRLLEGLEGFETIPEINRVDEVLADELRSLYLLAGLCSDLSRSLDEEGKLNYEIRSLSEERNSLLVRAKQEGKSITTCPNCGALIEVGA